MFAVLPLLLLACALALLVLRASGRGPRPRDGAPALVPVRVEEQTRRPDRG